MADRFSESNITQKSDLISLKNDLEQELIIDKFYDELPEVFEAIVLTGLDPKSAESYKENGVYYVRVRPLGKSGKMLPDPFEQRKWCDTLKIINMHPQAYTENNQQETPSIYDVYRCRYYKKNKQGIVLVKKINRTSKIFKKADGKSVTRDAFNSNKGSGGTKTMGVYKPYESRAENHGGKVQDIWDFFGGFSKLVERPGLADAIVDLATKWYGTEDSHRARNAHIWLASQIGINESGFNPQAVNPKSNATGLIQFMPKTARGLGTTVAALYNMAWDQQWPYVEAYFEKQNPQRSSIQYEWDFMMMIFYPVACGKGKSWSIADDFATRRHNACANSDYNKKYCNAGKYHTWEGARYVFTSQNPNIITVGDYWSKGYNKRQKYEKRAKRMRQARGEE